MSDGADPVSAVLGGADPAVIEQLHAQYLRDPNSVDPSWRRIFASEEGAAEDAAAAPVEDREAQSLGLPEPRPPRCPACGCHRFGRPGPGRDDRFDPGADDDPGLPGARPSHRQPRPPRPRWRAAPSRARPQELRLRRGGLRPTHLCGRRARAEAGDAARGAGDPQAHLLRAHRRRVHAHPAPGPEGLGAADDGGRAQPAVALARREDGDPAPSARGGGLRALSRRQVSRRQALLARRVGERDTRARGGDRPGSGPWRGRDRHRHGPPRAAQRADQHHGQVLRRRLLRVSGRRSPAPATSRARAT